VSEIPNFLKKISLLFDRKTVTSDDLTRTDKYKLMLAGVKAKESKSHDIGDFLRSLNMKLVVTERTRGNWGRALQLINKTNQFNANGIRFDEEKFLGIISQGGRVYTARLVDSNGDHGEIVSCLIDSESNVLSFVMSCRVFQRTVEYSFVSWLLFNAGIDNLKISVKKTEKNEPFLKFLSEIGLSCDFHSLNIIPIGTCVMEAIKVLPRFVEVFHEL
jgi:FkbH-like protein